MAGSGPAVHIWYKAVAANEGQEERLLPNQRGTRLASLLRTLQGYSSGNKILYF